ncbi:sensor domain-containing protein [Rhodococcus sp. BP-349]|nr:sensor domain-containing protein [Rhodococcus sp. BP-363]MBY6544940.1 sensor domain-containing protein [Rhodococcus sp. BP-369]MBY6564170.1 sensor domain-containing protein [Rhodococcus sp. BP-370]MBY6578893.1 sensor domain-containing protein [Rhodococcus sp. BP-364]MBY6588194.1 sensor domain-containing protein [Rhodococcus sp. BP-358]MBY6592531.1 sensor domain-containing protein [Rhodococcus sp. BP-362]MBY6596437.1 sensor domain-containing protein [Rhodococcus sp. BP-359]MBY6600776.1 sen
MRAGALVALAAAVLAGCGGSTVSGTPEVGGPPPSAAPSSAPGSSSTTPSSTPSSTSASPDAAGSLSALLLDPSTFTAPYQAVVLPPQAVAQAAQDLDGIAADASVEPAGCKPEARSSDPDSTALLVATDPENRATISIELSRVDTTLEDRKALWEQCSEVEATSSGVTSLVTTDIVPPPPIGADDTLALRRTVTSGGQAGEVTQSMLSLLAQVDDVRVTATYMSFGELTPDSATLDRTFTAAVQKVKAGG